MIKQIQSRSEFLTTSRTPSPDRIQTLLTLYPRALALVLFENLDMASSSFGDSTVVAIGPQNTFKSLSDCKYLNDLPSQRQYPTHFIERADFLEDR